MQEYPIFSRCVSLVLIFTMLTQFFAGCSERTTDSSEPEHYAVTEISTEQNQTVSAQTEIIPSETESAVIQTLKNSEIFISENWEDYIGNLDTFVYALIMNQYQQNYSTFNAMVTLSDGTDIFGIGYTDYAEYVDSDNTGYFPAGFLALIGEPEISSKEVENGLEIRNLDYAAEDTHFLYAYQTEPHLEHCVIWGEYLQYGTDTSGEITYTAQKYEKGICDKSLGSLYSYDNNRYLYDADVGNYVNITGESLSTEIDYAALEAEVNRILEEQDFHFSTAEINTAVHLAQEAVISYLLSLQEETFLDAEVSELIRLAQELDPMECIQITPDGMIYVEMGEEIPDKPDAKTKWLVGSACFIVTALSIGLQVACPAAAPFTGAASSAAIEIFMQVVFENQNLEDINWKKVAVSACVGALTSFAPDGNMIKIITGTISSAFTEAAYAVIDEESPENVWNATISGVAGGAVGSMLSVGISDVVSKTVKSHHTAAWQKIPDKIKLDKIELDKIELSEKAEEQLTDNLVDTGKELFEKIIEQETLKTVLIEIQHEINPAKLLSAQLKSFYLSVNDRSVPEVWQDNGNFIISVTENENPELKAAGMQYDTDEIKVSAGIPDLSPFAEYQFIPQQDILSNRMRNLQNYCQQLSDEWSEHPEQIPEKLKSMLKSDLSTERIQESLFYANLTFYESMDGFVCLMDKNICKNIGYYGNIALTKSLVMLDIAADNFYHFLNTAPSAITGTLILY